MRRVGLGLALLCLAFGTVTASAQDKYPSKPVKIVVPYAPGGATDIVARILGEQLRQITGQSFVVENKPGANGIVAINEMVNAKPDGYTLMLGNVTTNTITPVLTPAKVPNYDKTVVAVSRIVDIPEFLVMTTELQRQDRSRADRVRQEESRQAALRHRRRRQLPALRHGLLRQEGRQPRHDRHSQQERRIRGDQRHDHRRHPGLVPQRGVDRGPGQSRQAAAAGAGQPPAPARISRRGDDAGARLSRRRHHCMAGAVRAGRHPEGRAGDDLQGVGAGAAGAAGGRRFQEAELQYRAEQVARRRQGHGSPTRSRLGRTSPPR